MLESPAIFMVAMNWTFPPWIFAGIRFSEISKDWSKSQTQLRDRYFNMNIVGTHFGGSLYSMCDPVYMIMLMNTLNKREFIVWDKAAEIEYVSPGTGTVTANFELSPELIESLEALAVGEKSIFDLPVTVRNKDDEVVAKIVKTLYVKRKRDLSVQNSETQEAKARASQKIKEEVEQDSTESIKEKTT